MSDDLDLREMRAGFRSVWKFAALVTLTAAAFHLIVRTPIYGSAARFGITGIVVGLGLDLLASLSIAIRWLSRRTFDALDRSATRRKTGRGL